jgi:hypothetical protein
MYCNSSVLLETSPLHTGTRSGFSKTSSKEDKIPQVIHQNKQKMTSSSIYPKKSGDALCRSLFRHSCRNCNKGKYYAAE